MFWNEKVSCNGRLATSYSYSHYDVAKRERYKICNVMTVYMLESVR